MYRRAVAVPREDRVGEALLGPAVAVVIVVVIVLLRVAYVLLPTK